MKKRLAQQLEDTLVLGSALDFDQWLAHSNAGPLEYRCQ